MAETRVIVEPGPKLPIDGKFVGYLLNDQADAIAALIAACNLPRYDLPPGVIAGSDGKFYAPGDVVRTLPDEMWERRHPGINGWLSNDPNREGNPGAIYEVRPTAANPLQPLPDHTFRLPDGELACYRRDAAKLREAGAVLRYTTGIESLPPARDDRDDRYVLLVEFPAPPKTERVAWHEAVGRTLADNGEKVTRVRLDGEDCRPSIDFGSMLVGGDCVPRGFVSATATADGYVVEVLATDGAL